MQRQVVDGDASTEAFSQTLRLQDYVSHSFHSKTDLYNQRPMVHTTNRGVTQDFGTPGTFDLCRTKNVIDASIVNGRIAGFASQVEKTAKDMAIGLTVV